MISLPNEVQFDILKCLNFNQLFSVKQTNFYFHNLINEYEGSLARKEFDSLMLITRDLNYQTNQYRKIEPQSGVFEFTLNDQLKKKWQLAIAESIPLYLDEFGKKVFYLRTKVEEGSRCYVLELPKIPKNIEEMIIIRCWLEQLFKCAFECCNFIRGIFNPEMINILFDNDNKQIPLKFNIQRPTLSTDNKLFKNALKFCLNHLSVSEFIDINFESVDITEEHTNILFNILINEGNKFPKIYLLGFRIIKLYNYIEQYIQLTCEDCSKIVPVIMFEFSDSPRWKLNERAEKIKIRLLNGVKFTNYQISNIYNPKLRFSFCLEELIEDGSTLSIIIRRIKE